MLRQGGCSLRFEVIAAFFVGGMISVLETCLEYCRGGYKITAADFLANIDDYIAASLLLLAGFFAARAKAFSASFLVLAWAYCTSLMFSSFWGQVQDTLRSQIEPENTLILCGKLVILSVSLVALVMSFRRATAHSQVHGS
jgi:hypothetical protein